MSNFRVYHQNARGLRTKTDIFKRNVLLNDYDVITITESWLLDNIMDGELFDDRYCVWRRDRDYARTKQTRGGGVLIAAKRTLQLTCNVAWQSSAEDIWTTLTVPRSNKTPSFKLHLCCLYLCSENGGLNFNLQLQNFTSNITDILTEYEGDKFLILGDFNMSSITWEATDIGFSATALSGDHIIDFIDTLNIYNLTQFNGIPNSYGKILDLVLCTDYITVYACPDPLVAEDPFHKALCIDVPFFDFKPLQVKPRKVYSYHRGDYDSIRARISETDWMQILSVSTVENALELFYTLMYELRDQYIPMRIVSKNKYPPWYNSALIKIVKEKFKYHRKFKNYGNISDHLSFKLLRDRAAIIERECHDAYIARMEESILTNPKQFWTYMKQNRANSTYPATMSYAGTVASSGENICELFSSFFHSTFLSSSSDTIHDNNPRQSCSDIATVRIDKDEVVKLLRSLDVSKSAGPDLLPAIFFVKCASEISIPVSILFRRSIDEGIMPIVWKSAFITPIHKKGSRDCVEHYRPISKLCLLAKVFERIIYNQLYESIKSDLSPTQHGFLKQRSTVSNLLLLNDFVTFSMNAGDQVDTIYTDYSKAFDRIDHKLLLLKLGYLGIRGDLFRWFTSYVHNRSQAVVLNGYTSSWRCIPSGVPQGSLLGPLLFVIFITDIDSCFQHSHHLLFADDMKVYRVVNNESDALLLQQDLNRLDIYCERNKLDLNVSKCYFMTFTRKPSPFSTNYSVKNQYLTRVSNMRDLGVTHDSKLLFDKHIDDIVSKASKALGFLMRSSKKFKNMKTVKLLYCSYVRSHLEYACQVWNPNYETYSDRIEKIQRKFTRYLKFKFNISVNMTYEQRCAKFHLLPLHLRRIISDIILLIKIIRGSCDCPSLLRKININVPARKFRNNKVFFVPSVSTNYRKNSYILRACSTFNNLSSETDLDIFCSGIDSLKKYVIRTFVASIQQ